MSYGQGNFAHCPVAVDGIHAWGAPVDNGRHIQCVYCRNRYLAMLRSTVGREATHTDFLLLQWEELNQLTGAAPSDGFVTFRKWVGQQRREYAEAVSSLWAPGGLLDKARIAAAREANVDIPESLRVAVEHDVIQVVKDADAPDPAVDNKRPVAFFSITESLGVARALADTNGRADLDDEFTAAREAALSLIAERDALQMAVKLFVAWCDGNNGDTITTIAQRNDLLDQAETAARAALAAKKEPT